MSTVHPPLIHFFAGMGFRPAIWITHRDQYGDRPPLIVGDDAPLVAKWEAPSDTPAGHGFGFVLWPNTPAPAQLTAAELAQGNIKNPDIAHPHWPAGPLIPGPWHPPVDYPCNCITPDSPDMPPVAPVPVPASAGLLIAAVAAFAISRRRA